MESGQLIGLHANIPKLQAQERIREGRLKGLDHQGIFDLYMTAFEDEELANSARTQYLVALVEAKCNAAKAHR